MKSSIDTKFFSKLKREYSAYVQGRNDIIVVSRDILKHAKQAIFACHRNQLPEAARSLTSAEAIIRQVQRRIAKNPSLGREGAFAAALEEYAEARLVYTYLQTGTVGALREIELSHEIYIGALSDLTGELTRKAIAYATERNVAEVRKIHQVVSEILEQFITFDLLSHLRSKYDQARKNLRKIEEILYDLSLVE